ncbi:hypothetical protein AAMO2058_000820100 [Amorphochlora amoebiformis]|uniref:U3 small nucleolar RNA-associated protein 6 n=1 Tax=Amorphochlora amoebiformis TaxID=1561963 RepID=A0A7S0GNM7_9EUKA
MADIVQKNLEDMVPELEDLQQNGLFSKVEIKQIVKSRTEYEYACQRKSPNKIDYQRYIEYETNLELLRRKRKHRMGIIKLLKSDYESPRRISQIYERALFRFSQDISLWYQFIDHLESRGMIRSLRKVFPRALQMHPRNPQMWARAAAFEFSRLQDVNSSRILMQRGLRMNEDSRLLWVAFFTMEIRYIQKLLARRETLGIAAKPFEDRKEREFLQGALPAAIYRNCIGRPHLRSEVETHQDFLRNIPKPVPVYAESKGNTSRRIVSYRDHFQWLRGRVLEGLQDSLGDVCPEAWVSIAVHAQRQGERKAFAEGKHVAFEGERRAMVVFEESISALPTAQMYLTYAKFLRRRAAAYPFGHSKVPIPAKRLLSLCEEACIEGKELVNPDLYILWADTCIRIGRARKALEVLKDATSKYKSSPKAWLMLAEVYAKLGSGGLGAQTVVENALECERTLRKGLKNVPGDQSADLWIKLLLTLTACTTTAEDNKAYTAYKEKIRATYVEALNTPGVVCDTLSMSYLVWTVAAYSANFQMIKTAVEVILHVGAKSTKLGEKYPDSNVHIRCLEALNSSKCSSTDNAIMRIGEIAVERCGKKTAGIWLWLARWYLDKGNPAGAAKICWRAEKCLETDALRKNFLAEYRAMTS